MTAVILAAALVMLLQLAIAVLAGVAAVGWLVSPSSPAAGIARWWRRRIVAVMAPAPGRAALGGAW